MQKERNNDIVKSLPIDIKIEVVDLNDLDKDLKTNDLEKTKISNIEDLLFDFSNEDTSNEESYNLNSISNKNNNKFLDSNKYKKRNSKVSEKEIADLINYDYATEFNMNLAIKIDLLNRQIETLLANQKLIMAKLNI